MSDDLKKEIDSLGRCLLFYLTWSEWKALSRRPWPWIVVGLVGVFTELQFLFGIFTDGAFDKLQLAARISAGVSMVAHPFTGPTFGIILMASLLRSGWGYAPFSRLILARGIVITVLIAVLPVISFALSLVNVVFFEIINVGPVDPRGYDRPMAESLDRYIRAPLAIMPFALFTAVLATLMNRYLAAITSRLLTIIDGFLIETGTEFIEAIDWLYGLQPGHIFYYWIDQEDAIWTMHNILGLEDDLQGLLLITWHIFWMACAIYVLIRWRAGHVKKRLAERNPDS